MLFKNTFSLVLTVAFTVLLAAACNKDDDNGFTPACDGSTPTYDGQIATIINNNCTNAGCHNAGAAVGDWTTYEGMEAAGIFGNGAFETEVLIDMTMPQGSETLTEAELNLLQCWADNNFPEN